jgi:hypothetical protein
MVPHDRQPPTFQSWFRRGLRLSLIVGIVSAAWHSWAVFSHYAADRDKGLEMRFVYGCAARVSDDDLNKHVNSFGNVNAKDIFCNDRDFWISPEEIAEVRNGTAEFETSYPAFDGVGAAWAALIGVVGTILATLVAFSILKMVRWVWGSATPV